MEKKKTGFEICRTARYVKRYIDAGTTKAYSDNITSTHGRALGFFYNNRHRDIFQRDFEQEFNIRRSTASNILSLMEKNGLIERVSVSYDKRLKKIILTEKAVKIQDKSKAVFSNLEELIEKDISEEELQLFFAVLEKINNNLERKKDNND